MITILAVFLVFEFFFGHPAVRINWQAVSYDLQNSMVSCTVVSFPMMQKYHYSGYQPLITVVEPKIKILPWCYQKCKPLIAERLPW